MRDDLGGSDRRRAGKLCSRGRRIVRLRQGSPAWLGEKAGSPSNASTARNSRTGDRDPDHRPEATQEFIDKRTEQSKDPYKDVSYEGRRLQGRRLRRGQAVGVIGDCVVIADGEKAFKAAVDAAGGDSLAGEDTFSEAIRRLQRQPRRRLRRRRRADRAVRRRRSTRQPRNPAERRHRPQRSDGGRQRRAGVRSDRDRTSSDLAGEEAPDRRRLRAARLAAGDSFAAFAASGFGHQLQEAIDSLDNRASRRGPAEPAEEHAEQRRASISTRSPTRSKMPLSSPRATREQPRRRPGVTTENSEEATKTVDLGTLLRSAEAGVTAVNGEASGFSIRCAELGNKPLVVVAKDKRIAIGYGLPAALQGLDAARARRSRTTPTTRPRSPRWARTPISAFVDGPAALRLAEGDGHRADEQASSGPGQALPEEDRLRLIGTGTRATWRQRS